MKILYLANDPPLGSPLGDCPNAKYIADSLWRAGHPTDIINEAYFGADDVIMKLQSGLYDLLLTEEARLKGEFTTVGEDGLDIIKGEFQRVLDFCKGKRIPVVAWLTNLFYEIMRREVQVKVNPMFKADIVFTTDGGHDEQWKKAGVNHRLLRQGIFQDEAYISEPKFETSAEIGFIGGIYENIWPYRQELVAWLTETYGKKFEHFGLRGEIRHEQLNRLCAKLKIVVGDSVWSPNYWSNRVYEIIGRGGVLIMPKIPGLEKEFTPYKHYIPYDMGNFKQLKEIIDYYLEHDEEREKIRMAGFEYCKANYTYLHRVKEMLRVLKEEKIIK